MTVSDSPASADCIVGRATCPWCGHRLYILFDRWWNGDEWTHSERVESHDCAGHFPAEVVERFWSKVNKTETCWLWIASKSGGYGSLRFGGKSQGAHRVSWLLAGGIVPIGYHLDHLCRVRNCVRPDHLEPVLPAENTRRGLLGEVTRARWAAVSHCPQGHPYDEENTVIESRGSKPGSARKCLTCRRARDRQRKKRPNLPASAVSQPADAGWDAA